MPTLLSKYKSADRATKGKILQELIDVLRMPYPSVRRKIFEQSFTYPERVLIAQHYKCEMNDLFPPEPAFQIN